MASPEDLQQRAVGFAKAGDFGSRALEVNLELTKAAPANEGAWTRLARCYMEASQLDEATAALDAALQVNPQNTIARNLQAEVTKRRVAATTPVVSSRARSVRTRRSSAASPVAGFGRAEFAALGQLQPSTAVESLGPKVESLLMALNERPFAARAVETRNRAGRSGARLFRRNSFYPGGPGHLFAFHHGGRWEPQLNVGFFAAPQWGRDCVRAGIGFNLTLDGSDPDREDGRERAVAYFEHFQQMVSSEWRSLLTDWMSRDAGFIQYGDKPPSTDLLPNDAIGSLVNLQNAADIGWIFCGRWLFANQAADADILQDSRKLTAWMDESFTALLPLWSSLFRAS